MRGTSRLLNSPLLNATVNFMSFHVYIARAGFKETPIYEGEWIEAADHCNELVVEERKNRKGVIFHTVRLKSDKKQRLNRTPYGLVLAQNHTKELFKVRLNLAPVLESMVYSERLKPYESVIDWEARTKNYRKRREEHINEYKRGWYKRKLFWVILAAILGVAIGLIKS